MLKTKKRIDFTEGPLFWRLLLFMLPIIATNFLQILYDTADKMIVGQLSGDPNALGAIGSTTFISNLIINFMIGVGAGAGVVVARAYGARNDREVSRASHNAVILGIGMSLVLTAVAYLTAAPMLRMLDTNAALFDSALLYINIIYSSILATAIYNVGASILRAVGDSASSLYIGIISGLINVGLNVVLVLCGMSVAGVAIATVVSKYFSAVAVMYIIWRRKNESYAFSLSKLVPHKATILRMLRLGIPTGLQSACFSIANLASTKAINSFDGGVYISARTIGTDIDHFSSAIAGAFLPAAMNATAQNAGAGNVGRIKRITAYTILQSFVIVGIISNILNIFAGDISRLFISESDPDIDAKIAAVATWCSVMLAGQFLAGMLNSALGVVRGLGYSMLPLILNLIGTVGARLVWIYGFFSARPTRVLEDFEFLAIMYPLSWGATLIFVAVLLVVALVRLDKQQKERAQKQSSESEAEKVAQG